MLAMTVIKTTIQDDSFQYSKRKNPMIAIKKSLIDKIALGQTVPMKAANKIPTTEAFTPNMDCLIRGKLLIFSQKGSTPMINKKEGRKAAIKQIMAPVHLFGKMTDTEPR